MAWSVAHQYLICHFPMEQLDKGHICQVPFTVSCVTTMKLTNSKEHLIHSKAPWFWEANIPARTTRVVQERNDRKIPAFQDFLVVRGQPSPWLSNTHHFWSTLAPVISLKVDIVT